MKKSLILSALIVIVLSNLNLPFTYSQWVETNTGFKGSTGSIYGFGFFDNIILTGTDHNIFWSDDNCNNWHRASTEIEAVCVKSFVTCNSALYAGHGGGILKSTDWGKTWFAILITPIEKGVTSLVSDNDILYAGTLDGFFVSTDFGISWLRKEEGIASKRINRVEIYGDSIYICADDGPVCVSDKNNISWSTIYDDDDLIMLTSIVVTGDTIFVGTYWNGFFMSPNKGIDWYSMKSVIPSYNILDIKKSGNTIYLLSGEKGLYYTTNSGGWWNPFDVSPMEYSFWSLGLNNSIIILGLSEGGLLYSNDSGNTWNKSNNGLNEIFITSLLKHDKYIFTSTRGIGVYRTESGYDWVEVNNGLGDYLYSDCMAESGERIFVGNSLDLYESSDNGDYWSKDPYSDLVNCAPAVLTVKDNYFYVSCGALGDLMVSSDYGSSWRHKMDGFRSGGEHAGEILCDSDYVYIANVNGVFVSTNNGDLWTQSENELKDKNVLSLCKKGDKIFAGTIENGVYYSTNHGDSWVQSNLIFNAPSGVNCFEASGDTLFAGTDSGVFITYDDGENWYEYNEGDGNHKINCLLIDGELIYAGTAYSGIYSRNRNKAVWSPADSGITNKSIRYIAPKEDKLYVGTTDGIYLSIDNGKYWSSVSTGLIERNINTIAFKDNLIFAGSVGGGIYLSSNNGTDWQASNNGLDNLNINSLNLLNDNIFAGSSDGIFISSDNGSNWSKSISGLGNLIIQVLAVDGNQIWAGTKNGFYLSTDGGSSWIDKSSGLSCTDIKSIEFLSSGLFVGTSDGIYYSANGSGWDRIISGIKDTSFTSFATYGNYIFAGAEGGFYYSYAGTGLWIKVNCGLRDGHVTTLAVKGDKIFAGTKKEGVFSANINDIITAIEEKTEFIPGSLTVSPNPSCDFFTLKFELKEPGTISIILYNYLGEIVKPIITETKYDAGKNTIYVTSGNLSSGFYLCSVISATECFNGNILIIK
ncbi:MAG: hypothetical protein EPN82_15595 [Bacteroidetes bacterium]|nr:MAG: hypothetical protein EPN82_15595 [Bacteroidota bacterium]